MLEVPPSHPPAGRPRKPAFFAHLCLALDSCLDHRPTLFHSNLHNPLAAIMDTGTRRSRRCSSGSHTRDEENDTLLPADRIEAMMVSRRKRRCLSPLCLSITLFCSSLCILFAVLYVARHTTTTLQECDQRLSSYCRPFRALKSSKTLTNLIKQQRYGSTSDTRTCRWTPRCSPRTSLKDPQILKGTKLGNPSSRVRCPPLQAADPD